MKIFIKILSAFIAVSIIIVTAIYFFKLQPILSQFNISDFRFDSASSQTSGFPFRTVVKIDKPAIYNGDKIVWKGEGAVIEWRISQPASITVRLQGRHIATLQNENPAQAVSSKHLYLADTVGFVKLANLNRVVMDIRANKIGLYSGNLLSSGTNTKVFGAETVYFSYEGPSYLKGNEEGGDLNFSAEDADVAAIPNIPFKSRISRFTFKSSYDKKTKTHIVSNFILFWDRLKLAGNGTYEPNTGVGDFIIAVTGFESLVRALYEKKYLPADSVQQLIGNFNKLQEQQKKAENMPVYMPMSYRNNTIKLTGVDVFTLPELLAE